MSSFSKLSSLNKLLETGFVWIKKDGTYAFADVATTSDSFLAYTSAFGLRDDFFPDSTPSKIEGYNHARRLPSTEGVDIIGDDSFFAGNRAIVYVRSLTPENWRAKQIREVIMTNLVSSNSSQEDALNFFDNIRISCSCPRGMKQTSCVPPFFQRRMFRDYRSATDVPGPFYSAVYCAHAEMAHYWLATHHNVHGLGMHLPHDTYRTIGYVVNQISGRKEHVSKYRMNLEFSPEKREIFEPYLKASWRRQISPA